MYESAHLFCTLLFLLSDAILLPSLDWMESKVALHMKKGSGKEMGGTLWVG